MPFYEYNCLKCQTDFEELIRCDEDIQNLNCPECGSPKIEKKLSLFGMVTPSGKSVSSAAGGGSSCTGCAKHSCAGCH
ncbi:MAG: zinc ribbon domain-containing protein [FCB group bacterium]|nr:zinc ribbon domain-containing protein [FCB group bacterium]